MPEHKPIPSCWSNNGVAYEVQRDVVKPLFNTRHVDIKPLQSSIHRTDDANVALVRMTGNMRFGAFTYTTSEMDSCAEFESYARRQLLDELYYALYGPIVERVERLKVLIVRSDKECRTLFDELDVLLSRPGEQANVFPYAR